MNIDASIIKITELKNTRGRKTGTVEASLLDANGDALTSATAESKAEAIAALIGHFRRAVQSLKDEPLLLSFRQTTMMVFPHYDGYWWYGFLREQNYPTSTCGGSWETRDAAERVARGHLASIEWDGEEEMSPIILNEEDQQKFTARAREDKLFKVLTEQGWSDDEARYLVGGMGRMISMARFAAMPVLPEGIRG